MKKITTMAYVAALALVSTAGLTSCKSDEPGNDYNGEVVKTEFSISLPQQAVNGGPNRMPSTTVQASGLEEFQGIKDIMLVPFGTLASAIQGTDTRLGNNIKLTQPVAIADIALPSRAKVYSDVKIPLTTANFLFYGTSAATGSKFEVGSMLVDTANAHATPADFTFDLEPIYTGTLASLTSSSSKGGKLLAFLTAVARAKDSSSKSWYAYTTTDDAGMCAMFQTFITMKGLSTFEVERVLSDMYKSLTPLRESSSIADAVMDTIELAKYATVDGSGNVTLVTAMQDFPGSFNLPEGSISMKWDDTSKSFTGGLYTGMADPTTYTYPANLWYFVNSQIKTSNVSQKNAYDNATGHDWPYVLSQHGDGAAVNTRTRAVAITSPIQYGVARFDVAVRLNESDLADNSATVVGEATDVDCSAGFPVSAVFVGGQKQVGFDFTPTAGEHTEMTIYDNEMTTTITAMPTAVGTYSSFNHTLVLENGTADVMVAVEMTNTTGVDFYGAGGQLIPKGGKFYVVGQLTAASATETGGKVFKQDFTTTAKMTLKDLKTAYNTLPDLRTPQLELGFSVDLTWQSGHTYTVDFN